MPQVAQGILVRSLARGIPVDASVDHGEAVYAIITKYVHSIAYLTLKAREGWGDEDCVEIHNLNSRNGSKRCFR